MWNSFVLIMVFSLPWFCVSDDVYHRYMVIHSRQGPWVMAVVQITRPESKGDLIAGLEWAGTRLTGSYWLGNRYENTFFVPIFIYCMTYIYGYLSNLHYHYLIKQVKLNRNNSIKSLQPRAFGVKMCRLLNQWWYVHEVTLSEKHTVVRWVFKQYGTCIWIIIFFFFF